MRRWSEKSLLKFHPDERRNMSLRTTNYKLDITTWKKDLHICRKSQYEKDDKLLFEKHVAEKVNKGNSVVGVIDRSFEYMDSNKFILLYVRPHIGNGNSVWNSYKKKDITILEIRERRTTILVPGWSKLLYKERLTSRLPTLICGRWGGHMIEVFNMLKKKYDSKPEKVFALRDGNTTSGNNMRLCKSGGRVNTRRHILSHRWWTTAALPGSMISVSSVSVFERRIDKFWKDKDVVYNFKAQLATGRENNNNNNEEAEDSLLLW